MWPPNSPQKGKKSEEGGLQPSLGWAASLPTLDWPKLSHLVWSNRAEAGKSSLPYAQRENEWDLVNARNYHSPWDSLILHFADGETEGLRLGDVQQVTWRFGDNLEENSIISWSLTSLFGRESGAEKEWRRRKREWESLQRALDRTRTSKSLFLALSSGWVVTPWFPLLQSEQFEQMIVQVLSSANKLLLSRHYKEERTLPRKARLSKTSKSVWGEGWHKAGERGGGALWTSPLMKTAGRPVSLQWPEIISTFLESIFSSPLSLSYHPKLVAVLSEPPGMSSQYLTVTGLKAARPEAGPRGLTVCSWTTFLPGNSSLMPTSKCASCNGKEIKVTLQETSLAALGQPSLGDCPHAGW